MCIVLKNQYTTRAEHSISLGENQGSFYVNSTYHKNTFRFPITNSTDSLDFDLQLFSIVLWWLGSDRREIVFYLGLCV